MAKSERYQKGAAKMKELFGAEPQPGMMQEDFLNITVENLFGDIWNRPGLELRERSMITVAALTVLARERELKIHLRGALNAGISSRENHRDHDSSCALRWMAGRRQRPTHRARGL